jgi:hypothetical protein
MNGMLLAEFAIFVQFNAIRIILFVLHGVIVALFAFLTRQRYFYTHFIHSSSLKKGLPPFTIQYWLILSYSICDVNKILAL